MELLEKRIELLESKLPDDKNRQDRLRESSRSTEKAQSATENAISHMDRSKFERVRFKRESDRGRPLDPNKLEEIIFSKKVDEKDGKYAIEVLQIVDAKGHEFRPSIRILDENLKRLLASQLKEVPGHWEEEHDMVFRGDLDQLVFSMEKLQKLLNSDELAEQTLKGDLESLVEILKTRDATKTYLKLIAMETLDATISFPDLWMLFPAGELVYGCPADEPQVFIFSSIDYKPKRDRSDVEIASLYCWRYGKVLTV